MGHLKLALTALLLPALLTSPGAVPPDPAPGTQDAARSSPTADAPASKLQPIPDAVLKQDPRLRMTAAFTPGKLEPFLAEAPAPELTLLLTGHTAGWITPCGCKGNSGGGLARRMGYREVLKQKYPRAPVHFLDTGGFASLGTEVGSVITEAALAGMRRLGYSLTAVGAADLGLRLREYEMIRSGLPVPRISANVLFHDSGRPAFEPYRIIEGAAAGPKAAPIRVAVVGLNDDRNRMFAFGPDGRSLVAGEMQDAVAPWLKEARAKADFVLLIGEFRPDQAYRIVLKNPGLIDLIVCGDGSALLESPQDTHGVPTYALGSQGKYLGEIRFTREKGKVRAHTRVFLLDDRFPSDHDIALESERVLDRANEISKREVLAHSSSRVDGAPFLGAESCAPCHRSAFETWQASAHARAFSALERTKRDYTVSCTACHVTGQGGDLELGGGFISPLATPQLLNVQCEACHGAGQEHVQSGTMELSPATEETCRACHSAEQDPDFDFKSYWPKIAHK